MYKLTNINNFWLINIFLILLIVVACKQEYTPKPLGYHRIDFPEKEYQQYSSDCPFTFEYPTYGEVKPDKSANAEPCWLNLKFPEYNGTIHLSYKQVQDNLNKLTEDARNLTYKHTVKAEAITEKTYQKPERDVYGILYNVKGNAASSLQFFLTDSSNHFIRGSLYFNVQPNKDSLAPVIDFFREDVVHFMETFRWK
jgi:gliding motility-associated lipoprotein GldD